MSAAMKCGKCGKTVYDMEKQAYKGGFWHDYCFRCQTCNTKLVGGAQVDHGDQPHCKSCYDKNFRPKGFHGGGSSTTDSFQSASVAVHAASPVSPSPVQNTGGNITASGKVSGAAGGAYCTQCGEVKKGTTFCGNCGNKH